ncbi:MAG: hypothetical protein JW750_02035 [Anaerolineaceae bacterium]|nr:hypothetical protein [Anaerolineaceae bacterium]
MNNRERTRAILNYESYDRLPIVHFGYWNETLEKWAEEGHISKELAHSWGDGNQADKEIQEMLGFDFNWYSVEGGRAGLMPNFERKIVKENPDGSFELFNEDGAIVLQKPGAGSIPAEIDHLLKSRAAWEEHYLPKLQWTEERINPRIKHPDESFTNRDVPLGLMCGSLLGTIRNWLGVVNMSYIMADDPELMEEIVQVGADICYKNVEYILQYNDDFDFAHYWEDICFKNGPLISPRWFKRVVGPHYQRITELCHAHDIKVISVDCDGQIDKLIPTWFENGVNTMFPIEVGTWKASIAPWRETYGKELRGVGGMNKVVFAFEREDIDQEIERLKPLVDLGAYIPCPDHRIAPDAKWENVQYYCDRMRQEFGG